MNANGLDARTWFYPAMMLLADYEELPPHAGVLGRSLPELRVALRQALGIGTGSCLDPGAPAGSRRGRIVVVEREFAAALGTPLAAVVTEHRYSRERRYDVVVPILRGDGMAADPSVLAISHRPWFDVFDRPASRAFLPVQVAQSAWYADDVVRETPYVFDTDTLAAVDDRLCTLFGLPHPA